MRDAGLTLLAVTLVALGFVVTFYVYGKYEAGIQAGNGF